jgi:hypothetical protein
LHLAKPTPPFGQVLVSVGRAKSADKGHKGEKLIARIFDRVLAHFPIHSTLLLCRLEGDNELGNILICAPSDINSIVPTVVHLN